MDLSLQLKVARIEAELDQKQVADITGIAQSTISEIESGKTNPQRITLDKLAKAYGYELRIIKKGE